MVKRQADKQLTDRNCDDPDADETPTSGLMRTASPQAISQRKIRALPKKSTESVSVGIPNFGAISSLPTTTKHTLNPFALASPAVNPAPSTNLFSGLSNFAPQKTSIFAPSSTLPMSNNSSTIPKTQSSDPPNFPAVTKYYASLRGLNLSVLRAFEDLTKKDAFLNLSTAFDHIKLKYDQHRSQIQSEFKKSKLDTHKKSQPSSTAERSTGQPSFSFSTTGPSNPFSSPFVSQPHCGEHEKKSSDGSRNSATQCLKVTSRPGAFTMAAPTRPSPLRYESENVPTGSPPRTPGEPVTNADPIFKSNVDLSKHQSGSSSTPFDISKKQPTLPVVSSSDTLATPPSEPDSLKSKPVSPFGSISTNAITTAPSSIFGSTTGSKPFSFNPTAATGGSANKTPSIGFGFGLGGRPNVSVFGGFGSPKASTASTSPPKNGFNPVGFSFGNSPPTSSSTIKTLGTTPGEKGGIPGNESTSNASDEADNNGPDGSAEPNETTNGLPTTTTTTDSSSSVDSKNGEEDEETKFETTARIYAFMDKKQDNGSLQKSWVGWATSTVKLNRHQNTGRYRIFARSQANRSILFNFFVESDTKVFDRTNSVEILGYNLDGTQPLLFRVRPLETQKVSELLDATLQITKSSSSS